MHFRYGVLLIALFSILACNKGQYPLEQNLVKLKSFERTYGGEGNDKFMSVASDSARILILGESDGYEDIETDAFILCMDTSGNIHTEIRLSSWGKEEAVKIVSSYEGHFYTLTNVRSAIDSSWDFRVTRINRDGVIEFDFGYGGPGDQKGSDLVVLPGGDIVVLSTSYSFGNEKGDWYWVRLTNTGGFVWQNAIGTDSLDATTAIELVEDGLVFLGYSYGVGEGDRDYLLIKCDFNGDTLWTKTYGYPGYEEPAGIAETDYGMMMIGHSNREDIFHQMWMLQIDHIGGIRREVHFGGPMHDGGEGIWVNNDGTAILLGRTNSYGNGEQDLYLVKVDYSGDMIRGTAIGSSKMERADDLIVYQNMIYIVGYTTSFGNGTQGYLVKYQFSE